MKTEKLTRSELRKQLAEGWFADESQAKMSNREFFDIFAQKVQSEASTSEDQPYIARLTSMVEDQWKVNDNPLPVFRDCFRSWLIDVVIAKRGESLGMLENRAKQMFPTAFLRESEFSLCRPAYVLVLRERHPRQRIMQQLAA